MSRLSAALILILLASAPAHACGGCLRSFSTVPEPVWLGLAWMLAVALLFYRGPLARGIFAMTAVLLTCSPVVHETLRLQPEEVLATLMVAHLVLLGATGDRSRLALKLGLLTCYLVGLMVQMHEPRVYFSRYQCERNLEAIAASIDDYMARDGRVPESIAAVSDETAGGYVTCYAASGGPFRNRRLRADEERRLSLQWGVNFGEYGYEVSRSPRAYTIWCQGTNHQQLPGPSTSGHE